MATLLLPAQKQATFQPTNLHSPPRRMLLLTYPCPVLDRRYLSRCATSIVQTDSRASSFLPFEQAQRPSAHHSTLQPAIPQQMMIESVCGGENQVPVSIRDQIRLGRPVSVDALTFMKYSSRTEESDCRDGGCKSRPTSYSLFCG